MNNHNLIHINVQTNCNLSFSLLTIEELINHSLTNGVNGLALCEYNPYEFPKFYHLCRKSGLKAVWGFKRIVDYDNQQLVINFFPRRYSEYKELNKFFCQQDKKGIIKWSLLEKIISKCLVVLEIRNCEDAILITSLAPEILQYSFKEEPQNIYFGLGFLPDQIEIMNKNSLMKRMLPFFSIKSFNWDDHYLLNQLGRTSIASGFTDVFLKSIPYLSKVDLLNYFNSHVNRDMVKRSSDEFFSHLFINLDYFLSKINLFIKKSSSVEEKGRKFELLRQQCEKRLGFLVSSEKKLSYSIILGKELEIIKKKDYTNYFLELTRIIRILRKNNIEIGPGRGSATSSLVSYLLGLTLIDPVQNKLFFWRFLNEKRIDSADIDIDVEDQVAALHLIEKEYGRQSVAKLIVKKRIGWRLAVTASLKISSVEKKDSIFIEENAMRFLNTQENIIPSLRTSYFLEKYPGLFAFARRIYPLYGGVAPHPSGIIIFNGKLSEKLPIRDEGEFPLCLYQQKDVINLGFKKFDFLSLTESLSFIKYIKEKNPLQVPSYMELDLDDFKTWKLLRECLLVGIFQINTKSFSEIISLFQPVNFAELLLIISLNRPGASVSLREILQIHSANGVVESKHFESRELNEILSSTYGKIIFEEQVSQILSYSLAVDFAEAEIVRRSLKVIINNDEERRKFKLEFISKTTGKLKSFEKDILWEKIVKSIPYLFNKAHATSYAYLTYYTAYLKANFFTSALTYFLQRNTGDYKSTILLSEEAVLMEYKLETPDINTSLWEWKVATEGEKILLMGFSQLGKNSSSFFEKIIEERSKNGVFRDWKDLLTRLPQYFDSLAMEDLVKWVELGLFRSLSYDQQLVIHHLTSLKRYARIVNSLKPFLSNHLPFLSLLREESYAKNSLLQENRRQWESFHFYPSYLVRWKNSSFANFHYIKRQLFVLNNHHKQSGNSEQEIQIHAVLVNTRKTKNQYLLTLLLFNSSFEVFCTYDFYEKNIDLLEIHNEAVFTLKSRRNEFKNSLFVDSISIFEE